MVINWTIQEPGITSAIVGARNAEQAEHNAKALSFRLSPEECAGDSPRLRRHLRGDDGQLIRRSILGGLLIRAACPREPRACRPRDGRAEESQVGAITTPPPILQYADSPRPIVPRRHREASIAMASHRTPPSLRAFELARERYAELGVDVDLAMEQLARVSVSLHCWQGDDVGGFEGSDESLGGGLAVTGNYPGKARTPDELRSDLEKAYGLIPGQAPAQPPRQLCRDGRHEGRA